MRANLIIKVSFHQNYRLDIAMTGENPIKGVEL